MVSKRKQYLKGIFHDRKEFSGHIVLVKTVGRRTVCAEVLEVESNNVIASSCFLDNAVWSVEKAVQSHLAAGGGQRGHNS